jgi:UDP-2,3-diacylglucosamine pyrophosphatase LpxH
MDEYTIVSDLHLGSDVCRADNILEFLYCLETENLILNGDIFDNMDFRRLKKSHWKILKKLRQISKSTNVIWLYGNHDNNAEAIAHLIGCIFLKDYIIDDYHDKTIYVTHGDKFDTIIANRPIITKLADNIYRLIQRFDKWMDNDFKYSKKIKNKSKTLTRIIGNTIDRAIKFARKNKYDSIIIGHLHKPCCLTALEDMVEYANSGCWTEQDCHYIIINQGLITVKKFISGIENSTKTRRV